MYIITLRRGDTGNSVVTGESVSILMDDYEVWVAGRKKYKLKDTPNHRVLECEVSKERAVILCNNYNRNLSLKTFAYYRKSTEPTYGIYVEAPAGLLMPHPIIDIFEVAYNSDTADDLLGKYKEKHIAHSTGCNVFMNLIDEYSDRRNCTIRDTDVTYGNYMFRRDDEMEFGEGAGDGAGVGENEDNDEPPPLIELNSEGEGADGGADEDMNEDINENMNEDSSEESQCFCEYCVNRFDDEEDIDEHGNDIPADEIQSRFMNGLVRQYIIHMRNGNVNHLAENIGATPQNMENTVIDYLVRMVAQNLFEA